MRFSLEDVYSRKAWSNNVKQQDSSALLQPTSQSTSNSPSQRTDSAGSTRRRSARLFRSRSDTNTSNDPGVGAMPPTGGSDSSSRRSSLAMFDGHGGTRDTTGTKSKATFIRGTRLQRASRSVDLDSWQGKDGLALASGHVFHVAETPERSNSQADLDGACSGCWILAPLTYSA